MSTFFLKIMPTNPGFRPTPEQNEQAVTYLSSVVQHQNYRITASFSDQIQFIDSGANFERVRCPFCSAELDDGWWQTAMDKAFSGNYSSLQTMTLCCKREVSLNDLIYVGGGGFARYVIAVECPENDLTSDQIKRLEAILGQGLKKFYAHY